MGHSFLVELVDLYKTIMDMANVSTMFYVVDVDLDDGYNNIDFIALNEGESSPNTAQLIVLDEFGKQLSNKKWLISTGYKAKLVVFKK